MEWADHLRRNHARLNRKDSRANRAGPRKRCDFCGDQVDYHSDRSSRYFCSNRLFKLRRCDMWKKSTQKRLSNARFVWPLILPASHMLRPSRRWLGTWFLSTRMWVVSNSSLFCSTKFYDQVESYYEHMIYPETLYGAICSGKDCAQRGKILAFNPVALGVSIHLCWIGFSSDGNLELFSLILVIYEEVFANKFLFLRNTWGNIKTLGRRSLENFSVAAVIVSKRDLR